METEGKVNNYQFQMEELRSDLQMKTRHISELQNNLGEIKAELAGVREQKNSAVKEVRLKNLNWLIHSCL